MDLAPPPVDSAPVPEPTTDEPAPPQRVVAGVAALLAARLGVDALWVRIGFVLLALVGGVGILVYGAMWLAFVVGARPGKRWARVAGGVALVAGLPLVLTSGFSFFDGPFAVLALLVGLAVALWQPRGRTAVAGWAPPAIPVEPVATAAPPPAIRRPPSILGRLTLGVAVLVGAVGALIDHANGGRLHPEQWLGAAAVVCGIGLVAGAFAGRALWLVVPAVLFAGAGFVAGEAARIGVEPTTLIGDESIVVGRDEPGGWDRREHVAIGSVDVFVDGPPAAPVSIDARVGIGDVQIQAADDVTVELRTEADNGDITVNGVPREGGTSPMGPEGTPDVVVTARVGRGDIEVHQFEAAEDVPIEIAPSDVGRPTYVTDGVALASGGTIVLADGEATVDSDGTVLSGTTSREGGVTIVVTSLGDFRLLPGDLLLTPFGELIDLQQLRDSLPSDEQTTVTTTPGG